MSNVAASPLLNPLAASCRSRLPAAPATSSNSGRPSSSSSSGPTGGTGGEKLNLCDKHKSNGEEPWGGRGHKDTPLTYLFPKNLKMHSTSRSKYLQSHNYTIIQSIKRTSKFLVSLLACRWVGGRRWVGTFVRFCAPQTPSAGSQSSSHSPPHRPAWVGKCRSYIRVLGRGLWVVPWG